MVLHGWLAVLTAMAPATAQTATAWREAEAGYQFAFPRDHASHPDYKIEWW
jgi:predicted secreted hydrolase